VGWYLVFYSFTICSPFYWRWEQRKKQLIYLPPEPSSAETKTTPDVSTTIRDYTDLKQHLNLRYGVLWRDKVRLLLVTGDEAAIEQLVPGLQESQWLEGNRTVLIYGGSLALSPIGKIHRAAQTASRSPSGRYCARHAAVA
jgi:type VI secretion system protein ImpL